MAIEYKKSEVKRAYEGIIIMHPSATEEVQKALFIKNREIIKSFGGEVSSVETWGKRTLANPINKLELGAYFHTYFTVAPGAILELERTMKINDSVLRVVHAKLDDTKSADQHREDFKKTLEESAQRQQEVEAKIQKKRATRMRK